MKIITVQHLKKMSLGDILFIDTREPKEYSIPPIVGAVLLPLDHLSLKKLPTLCKTIVVYCQSGKRSAIGATKLLQENPNLDLYSLEGGIMAWNQEFLVQKSKTCQK